jgi:alpha-tubulin suppressor-like RCC1 family protein
LFFRFPKNVEILLGKKVTEVAVGAKHVVVATEDNQVFGWGSNEHIQLGSGFPALVAQPTLLCSLRGKSLSGESNFNISTK